MYKIAVMGDRESIYGFAALGMTTFVTDDGESAAGTLKKLAHNDYGIIYITEALAAKVTIGNQSDDLLVLIERYS